MWRIRWSQTTEALESHLCGRVEIAEWGMSTKMNEFETEYEKIRIGKCFGTEMILGPVTLKSARWTVPTDSYPFTIYANNILNFSFSSKSTTLIPLRTLWLFENRKYFCHSYRIDVRTSFDASTPRALARISTKKNEITTTIKYEDVIELLVEQQILDPNILGSNSSNNKRC